MFATIAIASFTGLLSDTLIVDVDDLPSPPDFYSIQAAIDAAVDGDVILIRTGTGPTVNYSCEGASVTGNEFEGFIVDGKALTITTDGGDAIATSTAIRSLAPGQSVSISGLSFIGTTEEVLALSVDGCAGPILIQDSLINAGTVRVGGSNRVVFVDSDVCAGPNPDSLPLSPLMEATNSVVDCYSTSFVGFSGLFAHEEIMTTPFGSEFCVMLLSTDGGDAVSIIGGEFSTYGGAISGGSGGDGELGCPTVNPFTQETEYICGHGSDGGDGVALLANAVFKSIQTDVSGGPRGIAPFACDNGFEGLPLSLGVGTWSQQSGSIASLGASGPVAVNEVMDLAVEVRQPPS